MNDKQLKTLAEAHVFTGRELSDEEYNALRESKYSHLIKRITTFEKLLEFATPNEGVSHELPKSYRKFSGFNLGVNKQGVDHLIDMVEDHFHLGVDNSSTRKFAEVNLEDLKNFILKHGDEEGFDRGTDERIHHIINKPNSDVYSIMKGLYALGH
jgi:hypothetical protein